MRKVSAIFQRDCRIAWSYRFSFIVENAGLVISLLSLKFVSQLFGGNIPRVLDPYGGDYFGFALLGVSVSSLSYPAVKAFAQAVRSAQVTGTLEAMLTTRASPLTIVLGSGIYPITVACVQLVLLVATGKILLGAHLHLTNPILVVLVLAMGIVSLAGIGLMSAAFVIVFKQTEPFTSTFLAASLLLSGIVYPLSVLPPWLRSLAQFLPITHAIELTRELLLTGASGRAFLPHLVILAGFCLLLPAGALSLSAGIDWAKRSGSLSHY
jgi:ABC-2 type transport system permease protein